MAEILVDGFWDTSPPIADLVARMATPQAFTFVMPGRWPIPGFLVVGTLFTGTAHVDAKSLFADSSIEITPTGPTTRRRALLWRGRRVLASWGAVPLEVPNG